MTFSQAAYNLYLANQESRRNPQPIWRDWPTVGNLLKTAGVELSPSSVTTTIGELCVNERVIVEHHDLDGNPMTPPTIGEVTKLPSDGTPCFHISREDTSTIVVIPTSLADQYNFYAVNADS